MNISAKDFLLNEERISQIIDCLDQSPLPLREIALLMGSRSEYYLNAVFKKYRGIPPPVNPAEKKRK
ncbi:MAG: hypothetical protein IKD44_03935 [Lentisphaeria bacterium]|nr:hypothetical protein [Lentisphaeria bacterium]